MPRVSILTALYNHEKFVANAIESVLAQTYTDWELILWDDGSTDKSMEVAQKYLERHPGKITLYAHANGVNLGQERTRNAALGRAGGEYVALLDSDDFYHARKLELLVPLLDDPEVGLAYGDVRHVEWSTGREFASGAKNSGESGTVLNALFEENFLGAAATLIRRSALPNNTPFDSRFKTCGEYPLWIEIAKNWKFAYTPHPVAYWRVHGENTSLKFAVQAKKELLDLFQLLKSDVRYVDQAKAIQRQIWKRKYDYASEAYSAGMFEVARSEFQEVASATEASRKLRTKSRILLGTLKLGEPANLFLSRAKKRLWSIRNPRAGV